MFSASATDVLRAFLTPSLVQALQLAAPSSTVIAEAHAQLERVLAQITPFVPAPIVALAMEQPERDQLMGTYRTGSLVSVELPGFTDLAQQLTANGRHGSEETGAIINQLLGLLLEEIHGYNGGLIKFGGQTLLAFFDARQCGQQHAALACAAALGMQQRAAAFESLDTSRGTFRLQPRMIVHTGTIFLVEAGDASHMELIIAGRAMNQIVQLRESVAPDEILITADAYRLAPEAQVQQKSHTLYALQGLAHTPTPPKPIAWIAEKSSRTALDRLTRRIQRLKAYLPRGFTPQTHLADAPGEFRPLTVVSVDFSTVTRLLLSLELPALLEDDLSILGQVLNVYYQHTQSLIHQYGGSINAVDEALFGNRITALFGAPRVHEDDPARAVLAALDLRDTLADTRQTVDVMLREWFTSHPQQRILFRQMDNITLQQRIGLAGGTAFTGLVGTPQRQTYTAVGTALNIATQLVGIAENDEVLLTSLVYRASRHMIEAEQLRKRQIIHGTMPIPVLRVVARHPSPTQGTRSGAYTAPLAGRHTELACLLDAAQRVYAPGARGGHVVTITGEPGIGKSRLLDEMLHALRRHVPSLVVVRATCQSYEQHSPHLVATRLLKYLLLAAGAPDLSDPEVVQQTLDRVVPEWSRFAPLLAPLLDLALPETTLTSALTPEQRSERVQDLIAGLVAALSRAQPLAIIVDDLHWADASSLALVQRLTDSAADAPLLLVLAYHTDRALPEPWCDDAHCTTLELEGLDTTHSKRLLADLLGSAPSEDTLPLITRAQGNPFFLEELVGYLRDSGALQQTSTGTWIPIASLEQITLPNSIEQLISARLDRVSAGARSLVNVAAVLGQQFDEPLLRQVARSKRTEGLAELVNVSVLVRDPNAPTIYAFKHGLIRDVAYARLLYAERKRLHARVARLIEQEYSDQLTSYRPVLAQHYRDAEQYDRAFKHFLLAAQHAKERYANREALALYDQALATAPWRAQFDDPPNPLAVAAIYEQIGDVHARTGSYEHARQHYDIATIMYVRHAAAHPVQQAALERKVASTFEHQGAHAQALIWLQRATATIADAPPGDEADIEHARIFSDMGWLHFRRNEFEQAQQQIEAALAIFGQHEDEHEIARVLNRLGGVAWQRGDVAAAQRYVEQSLEVSRQAGNLAEQANALTNLAVLLDDQGQIERSVEYNLQAMTLNQQMGDKRRTVITALNIGWAFYNLHNCHDAYKYFSEAATLAQEVRDSYHHMRALRSLGRVLAAMQHWDDAERAVLQSQYLATQLAVPSEQLEGYVALAELALERNALDSALAEYQQAQALATTAEGEEYGRFQRLEARIALARGDTARAVELLKANADFFTSLHNLPEANRTRQLLESISNTN